MACPMPLRRSASGSSQGLEVPKAIRSETASMWVAALCSSRMDAALDVSMHWGEDERDTPAEMPISDST